MPLSISSSNERVPHCQYKKLWILSGCLCLIFSLIVESTYRIKGYLPNVDDNITLWSYWRNQVYPSKGRKKMVIIGASRPLSGIVPKILEMEFPKYEVIQLAIAGEYCYAALEDLANDVNFDGIVICSFIPDLLEPSKLDDQKEYVEYYKHNRMSLNDKVNLLLSGKIQENLCIMSSYNTPKFIVQDVIVRHDYYVPFMKYQFNRYRPAFFSTKLNAQQLEKVRIVGLTMKQTARKAHDAMQMDEYINAVGKTISPLSDKMVAKNGAVLFVRMPESGEFWNESVRRYPKDLYWDEFARRCNAPTIHFTDFPELSKFECPDGVHLDYPDAMEFTKNLSDIIKEHDYLP